ncbi:MAG: aminotransferase class I/II-fold pyridoxal phosphate-dependent enzyme [Magnetococcales bacterium]|nr:aminotransferase class I/II-fold pyridoxal phosphate-dependent enzyme [Magnetococcales bacterium]MBF0437763.1 aminotransferase class I/II-fold pyridoxal phosphate-dependent enzyme [Magnetococcales bacterium]
MQRILLAVPDLTGNEARYLRECVTSNFVSSVGPFVDRFESMVAEASGAGVAVAVSSGTCGLHVALLALGVGPGDLVIVPSLTFIASANAVAHCGATPWLVDVEADSWNLDPVVLADCLAKETHLRDNGLVHRATGKRVAAIMAVHSLGLPANMEAILGVARPLGVPVIADAAAALGASHQGRLVGDLGADLSVFSFNGNKTITCGGGGAVVGNDEKLLGLVRHLTTTARLGNGYDHDRVGFNYRMTNLQAAVGCAQLERLERLVAAKRRIRTRYDQAFADLHHQIMPFPNPPGSDGACWFSGCVVLSADLEKVDQLRAGLQQAGIDARPFWKPIHLQLPYRDAPKTLQPVSEQLWSRVVTLPCASGLTQEDQDRVIFAVRALL